LKNKYYFRRFKDVLMNNTVYLLTGAAGFLGSNIFRILTDRGGRARVLVLENDPAAKMAPRGVEKITGDLPAEGIIACAEKGRKGEGCIMSNSFVTIGEPFRLISKRTGSPEVKIILPIPLAKVIAFISGTVARLRKKTTMSTTCSVYNLARNNDFDCSKAMMDPGLPINAPEKPIPGRLIPVPVDE
jgi:hypothetical protein